MKIIVVLMLLTGISQTCLGQNTDQFEVFTFSDRYNDEVQSYLDKNGYENIQLITPYFIDPKSTNKVDKSAVVAYLTRLYPKRNDKGYCVIDWERKLFKDL